MAKQSRPVFVPGTNLQYPSASAAAKALGINAGNIYSVLSGKRKSAGGYQFGYTANRAVYIPETGKAYNSIHAAARAVRANQAKVERIVSNNLNKTVKGYHFTYIDASKLKPASIGSTEQATPKRTRDSKKQERIKAQREKQQKKQERKRQKEAIRNQERAESAKQHKKQELINRLGESYKSYQSARNTLQKYVESINKMIDEYTKISPALVYYHQATPAVFGMQLYIGYDYGSYDIPYFDETLKKFELSENITKSETDKITEKMQLLYDRLKKEAEQKGRNFFDTINAEQNRTALAFEFFKTTGHEDDMDKYAYMIWDIIDVINRSTEYEELGSDLIFNMVSDAMKGDIDPQTLEQFINDLDGWMQNNGSEDELNEILSELYGTYQSPRGFSIFDDDAEDGWLF